MADGGAGETASTTADAESVAPVADRLAFVDALRGLAVCRVVVNHALPWGWIQWFPSMPILFFFSGTLVGRSLQTRGWKEVFVGRLRRLALPVGVYLAFVIVMEVTGLLRGATIQLWYLEDFVVFTALSGIFLRMIRRAPRLTLAGLLAMVLGWGLVAGALKAGHPGMAVHVQELSSGAAYGFFWVLGMVWAERDFAVPRRNQLVAVVVAGTAIGVATVAFMHGGIDATAAANLYGLALAGTGLAGLALGLVFRRQLEVLMHVRGVGRFMRYINHRLLTVFLWHVPALLVGWKLAHALDLRGGAAALLVLAVTISLTAVATALLGGLEDRAAASSKKAGSAAIDLRAG